MLPPAVMNYHKKTPVKSFQFGSPKNDNSVVCYSPLSHSNPVLCVSVVFSFCKAQKEIFFYYIHAVLLQIQFTVTTSVKLKKAQKT